MKIWLISDTHFGHEEILDLDKHGHRIVRPFADMQDMQQKMVASWNEVVGVDDTVFHLGDLAWDLTSMMVGWLLNGNKKLILGNHDRFHVTDYGRHDFEVVTGNYPIHTAGGWWTFLSHAPLHNSSLNLPGIQGLGNIHGHIHEQPGPSPQHFNVSVERIGYRPILLEEAVAALHSQQGR